MKSIHYGSAEGSTWTIIVGTADNTDNDAIEAARKLHGADWIMPILPAEKRVTWPRNPMLSNGEYWWLLKMV